ncbi:MAG: hypothetical protein RL291_1021, partial [Pseudomonadota bacterium]
MDARDRSALEDFLDMLAAERGAAKNTLDAYRRDLEAFGAAVAASGATFASLKKRDIERLLIQGAADLAPATRARKLSAIRQLFKFLVTEELIDDDPTEGLTGPKKERPLP